MKWTIPAFKHAVWQDFAIDILSDLILETDKVYQLVGANGAGKSSFIKKILIPAIQSNPDNQYILYIEQQIQSQFDAVKSYAALQKPSARLKTFGEMIEFQIKQLSKSIAVAPRPCMIILDECNLRSEIISKLARFKIKEYCLVVVSHQEIENDMRAELWQIRFDVIDINNTRVALQ